MDHLEKYCLSDPRVGQIIFEQFLIHMVFVQKRKVQGKKSTHACLTNHRKFTQELLLNSIDEVFHDLPSTPSDNAPMTSKKGKSSLARKQTKEIDDSF